MFHCVHFECPAEQQALKDYEATQPASPVQAVESASSDDEMSSSPGGAAAAHGPGSGTQRSGPVIARATPAPAMFAAPAGLQGAAQNHGAQQGIPPLLVQPAPLAQGMGGQPANLPPAPRSPGSDTSSH